MLFIHAADLHLDSPLRGLERYEGAPVDRIRGASRRALSNLIDVCLAEQAAFLLLAGDIFDGDWKDYGTGLFFAKQMARLQQADVPVYLVRGNHDAASHVTRHLQLPDNVHELGARRAETHVLDRHGVAIHGQSFATRAVTDDLSVAYPAAVPGALNIGLLHTCAEGRPGHERYAPCALEALIDKGYDYWALGHVHQREVLARTPWVVFPGNLQGRHARETGSKGATAVTVEGGRVVGVEHRALDVVRWTVCAVDAIRAASPDAVVDEARTALAQATADAQGRMLAARVSLSVGPDVHRRLVADGERWTEQVRAMAFELAPEGVWLERIDWACDDGAGRDGADVDEDAVAHFVHALRGLRGADDATLAALALEELSDVMRKLPAELRDAEDGLRLDDPATVRRLLADVESLVVGRLGGPASEQDA